MQIICNIHNASLREKLKNLALKVTLPRLGVLDALMHAKTPLRIQDIKNFSKLKNTNLATVYRIINNLVELGVVYSPALGGQEAYFELKSFHHHHLVCEKCGRIEDLLECPNPDIAVGILNKKGFSKVLRHSLEYFGLCRKCV